MLPRSMHLNDSSSDNATSAQEEAYQHILFSIRMGLMRPGDRLIPEEIATSLGMSRMPVREAFRRLATEGLVVMRPNRGVVVRYLSEAEVQEVFEMRAVLEGLAAATAAKRATSGDLLDLEDLLTRMKRCESNSSEWITAHRHFHERLCTIAVMPRLAQQVSALHSVVEPLMRIWLESSPSSSYVQEDHEELLQMLRGGDADAADQFMRAHVRKTITEISDAMRRRRTSADDSSPGSGEVESQPA